MSDNYDICETLTVKELQAFLKIGTNAAYNLIHSNGFPVIRIGQTYRIPTKAFQEWLHKNQVPARRTN